MKLLIKNIKGLVGVFAEPPAVLSGLSMNHLPVLEDAWLAVEDGLIVDFGSMSSFPGITDWTNLDVLEADGAFVLPGWCDSHTHTVFARSRAAEFEDKINGLSYEEIALRGGGIINSALALQQCSEQKLLEDALARLERMKSNGTVAVEIKTGYGLNVESELKMLRVINLLKKESPLTITSTLLLAHALPPEWSGNPDGYVDHMIEHLLPPALETGFDFIDLFCERDYFQVHHLEKIAAAGQRYGKRAKIHLNQFYSMGGVAAALPFNPISLDHMEVMEEADWTALQAHPTVVTALPACSLFTKIPYTPVRKLMDNDIPVALATDFNPGSSPNGNMNLVNSLGCIMMGMKPMEVVAASTINGAAAMGLADFLGTISPGKKADLIITEPMEQLSELFYYFGEPRIARVLINGR